MAHTFYTEGDLRDLLGRELAKRGAQKRWAQEHGISGAYVSDFLNSRRRPGDAILRAMGFDVEPHYRRSK